MASSLARLCVRRHCKNTGQMEPPPAKRPHVLLLSSPGAGHLFPLGELARRLVERHGFAATLVTFTVLPAGVPASAMAGFLPAAHLALPAVPHVQIDDLPSLRALLLRSGSPLAALVADMFCMASLPLAAELGVPGYVFVSSNLTMIALLHEGATATGCLPVPLELPGGLSLRRRDLPDGYRGHGEPRYELLVEMYEQYRSADGVLANTFYEMEPAVVDALGLGAERGESPPVFPVGPFVRSDDATALPCPCLEWLDRQPKCSVVYVSFGSGGALSLEQTAELAAGLEASGHRFLWVVRRPISLQGSNSKDDDEDPLAWLPEGFLERTAGRGLALAAWAPQTHVLSHPATAAFVSHCGWNSALESVAAGVPMVAWPLYAEQRLNAALLEGIQVALPLPLAREEDDGRVVVVPREEIAAAVKELMEEGEKGLAVRRRAGCLQQAAARAWSAAPDGPSRRALDEVAAKWMAALGNEK